MPTLSELLLSNPHGWGTNPPAIQYQGDIRNPDDPYYGTGGPSMPAKLAYMLSGIPMAQEGIQSAREGSLAGDPVKAAGGVAKTALAAVPGMGRAAEPLFSTMPRLAAMLTAGGLAPAAADGALSPSPASAGEASNPLTDLYTDRAGLTQQINRAMQVRDMEGQSGKGPKWQAADSEVARLQAQKAGLDQMIQSKEAQGSPEHALQLEQMKKQQDDANAAAEMDKPFAARHPNVATAMAVGAPVVSGVLARYGLGKVANKGEAMLSDLLQARKSGDVPAMQEAASALDQWQKWAPTKQALSIAVPATLPADARVMGDVIDKYSLPDTSEAQHRATAKLGDPVQYAKDAVPALASGLVFGGVGAKLAPSAPRGDAKAMLSLYGGKTPENLADILKQGSQATADVQGPIGLAERSRLARAARNQQLESGSGLVQEAAGATDAAAATGQNPQNLPSLSSQLSHNGWQTQVRKPDGKFGKKQKPKNDN